MAGVHSKVELADVDAQALRLPGVVDAYPTAELNQALYRWLTALCAAASEQGDWVTRNQQGTLHLLENYRGLAASYWQLVAAELQRRPDHAATRRGAGRAQHPPDAAASGQPGHADTRSTRAGAGAVVAGPGLAARSAAGSGGRDRRRFAIRSQPYPNQTAG